ncbi:MAG: hypothetical protein LH481_04250 [Burkholderiales bacterium]|nr:hypothetical protein [Burkholderiales bacterium]
MSSVSLEAYLARLYTDATARQNFLADPAGEAQRAGLSDADASALQTIDEAGLRMAATSFANKRAQHRRPRQSLYDALTGWWANRRSPASEN